MENYFSDSYQEARQAFSGAAQKAGAELETILHPLSDPNSEPIATDAAASLKTMWI